MSPLWVSYRSMTSRFPPFAFVELVSPYNKKNITRWLEDMNCMFSWQEQYLTREILFLPLEHKIHIFEPPCNILYFHFTCTRSITLVVPWQICQNWYCIRINILWLLLRFQIPRLRSEHFRFVAQTCRGQSVFFCIICTTSWAVLHLPMLIIEMQWAPDD